MKKLFLAALFLGLSSVLYATPNVWVSSHTATADTTKVLCPNYPNATDGRGIIHGLCVNTGTAGTYTLYNSSAAAVNTIAAISTASTGCLYYDIAVSSGITYTNSATADVTLLYGCY